MGGGRKERGWYPGTRRSLLPRSTSDGKLSGRAAAAAGARARLWRRYGLRAFAALTLLLLALHLTSGSLVSVTLVPGGSSGSGAAAQLEDLVRLSGDSDPADAARHYMSEADNAPKLIPRVIHQTYKTGQVPAKVQAYMATWRRMNPGWDVRFYDDHDCLEFVKREFPEYLDAYKRLPKDVERSDFFRYMVILRVGGVYADIDTECKQPLDTIIRSSDTLIVGWQNEFPDAERAVEAWHVRTRQLLQWAFAAAPGHPALKEVCERVAGSLQRTFSLDTHMDTMERTGNGVFTDVILKHADMHAPHKRDDPWTVRILPRVQFGAPHVPAYGLSPNDPSVVVVHHALASWRIRKRWFWERLWKRSSVEDTSRELSHSWHWHSEEAKQQQVAKLQKIDAAAPLYPVSVVFDPTFDMFTHLVGHGERQSGWDVSSALTTHGSWQPSVQPSRRPSLADALVGSLGIAADSVLVDVGAGYGFFSLAAAARGHRVHAFELAPASLDAFEASIKYNGFQHLIEIHKLPLGAPQQEEYICIVPRHKGAGSTSSSSSSSAAAAAEVEMLRGYSTPQAHQTAAMDCQLMAKRTPGMSVLEGDEKVAALRVSANGWEGFVLEGFEPLLQRRQAPPVVAVEWNPAAMRAVGYDNPLGMVQRLYELGYTDVSHSGYICDERWYSVTYGVRRRGGITPEDLAALKQPTWCRLLPENFGLLLERASSTYPETLLFINKQAGQAFNATASSRLGGRTAAAAPPQGQASSGEGAGTWSVLRLFTRQAQQEGGAQQQQQQQQQEQPQQQPPEVGKSPREPRLAAAWEQQHSLRQEEPASTAGAPAEGVGVLGEESGRAPRPQGLGGEKALRRRR